MTLIFCIHTSKKFWGRYATEFPSYKRVKKERLILVANGFTKLSMARIAFK